MIDRILPDLYRITLPMPFRLRHVHVYALLHEGRVALFDTGMNIPETYKVLDEALATLGKTTKDIDHIFLTHFHADHCGIAGAIQKLSGAAVRLSAVDEMRLQYNNRHEELIERARSFFLPQGLPQKAMDNADQADGRLPESHDPFPSGQSLGAPRKDFPGGQDLRGHPRARPHGRTDVLLFPR